MLLSQDQKGGHALRNYPFLLTVLLCLSTFKGNSAFAAADSYRLPDAATKTFNSVHYIVSPQIELISIVQAISDYPKTFGFLMQPESFQYKTDVWNHFGAFRNHPVVKWLDEVCTQPRKMNFSAPAFVMLYTDNRLNLRTDLKFDDFVLSRAGGIDSLKEFLDLLKDFAVKSNYNEFYENHASYYRQIINGTISQADSIDHVKELEAFYGTKQKSFNIVLVSLYNHVGYGNSIVYNDGQREVFDTMGPQKIENGLPYFGDGNYLKYITRHEFSHPFVNPLTEKYWNLIKDYSANYDSIPETAKKNVCGDWQECIDEFVVRAVTVHVAFMESKEAGAAMYRREKAHGVSYLDRLLAALSVYSKNRAEYPTFSTYYPKLLDVFKE